MTRILLKPKIHWSWKITNKKESWSGWITIVHPDIIAWLTDLNIQHEFKTHKIKKTPKSKKLTTQISINFDNTADAIYFKLKWG